MANRPLVFDMNHADASSTVRGKVVDHADFAKAKAAGFRGVIHKATEGTTFADPLYKSRRTKAIAAGLRWGAYHFMRPGDVGDQVTAFLKAVGPYSTAPATRYALDYEDARCGLWQAEQWLNLVHLATKQRPWLYGGDVIKEQIIRSPIPSLIQYPLWLAQYGPHDIIPAPWKTCVLWQRSGDGIGPGPHNVPGIGLKEDINWFDGTDEQLGLAWLDRGPGVTT
jgi:lysozyme